MGDINHVELVVQPSRNSDKADFLVVVNRSVAFQAEKYLKVVPYQVGLAVKGYGVEVWFDNYVFREIKTGPGISLPWP